MMPFHSSDSAHLGVPVGGSLSSCSPRLDLVLFHMVLVELSAFSLRLSSLGKENTIIVRSQSLPVLLCKSGVKYMVLLYTKSVDSVFQAL